MPQAKIGDTVKVNYTGRLDNGSVFDTTENRKPLQFVLGKSRFLPGFQNAVLGMSPGESKCITVPVEEAFGARRQELVVNIDRSSFASDVEPRVGQHLQLTQQDDSHIDAVVAQVTDTVVTVDANHPLAGHPLSFEISLLEVA